MAARFEPMTLAHVEEGHCLKDFENYFAGLQERLELFVAKYGARAVKAKAKITLTLTVEVSAVEEHETSYKVLSDISTKEPGRPQRMTMALSGESETGRPALVCRASGSSPGNPRQLKMATEDGRAIDPETGRPIDKDTGELL